MKKTALICLCLALTACASESTEVLSETSETESTDKQAMSSLFNDTKIIADWNYGTMYGLNKDRGQDVITWRYNGSGGAEFGIFDISGYDDVTGVTANNGTSI